MYYRLPLHEVLTSSEVSFGGSLFQLAIYLSVSMRILLVEDDRMIGESLVELLQQERYVVQWVQDADSADVAVEVSRFDLIVLDLGLPTRDGLTVLRRLREQHPRLPVLLLTALVVLLPMLPVFLVVLAFNFMGDGLRDAADPYR